MRALFYKAPSRVLPFSRGLSDVPTPHMSPNDFRAHGKQAVEWVARYMEDVERYPVLSRVKPGDIRKLLPANAPEQGEAFSSILADLDRIVMPGITHWQSPNFFAFFSAPTTGPSILGDLVSSGLGVQGMLWATSPACTEVETHMMDWLVDMLALPVKFRSSGLGGGVIQDSASSATLCSLLAARTRLLATQPHVAEKLVAYTSEHAHSSVEKGMKIIGLGSELRKIPGDSVHRMDVQKLAEAIRKDLEAGFVPFYVCAAVGTTSSAAVDPVLDIGKLCSEFQLWLHVDAAQCGSAALCPEFRPLVNAGLEYVDSYCFNPHKWMLVNFDCDCFYVTDRKYLINALSISPEYLRNQASQSGAVIDYRDWQVPLGRRFRALKLWFVIRHYGIKGLQQHIRWNVKLAQLFADEICKHPEFELVAPPSLSLVCFKHKAGKDMNVKIQELCNASGQIYLTHTTLNGEYVLRFNVGAVTTATRHVLDACKLIIAAASGTPIVAREAQQVSQTQLHVASSSQASVLKIPHLTVEALKQLFEHRDAPMALIVPKFADISVCNRLAEYVRGAPLQPYSHDEVKNGKRTMHYYGVDRLDIPFNSTLSEDATKEAVDRYYAGVATTREAYRRTCGGPTPVDLLRLQLDDLWPGGANVAEFVKGRKNFAGLARVMKPETSHLSEEPHVDHLPPSIADLNSQYAANIFFQVPEQGGELELWKMAPFATDEADSFSLMKEDWHAKEKLAVKPELGDLIIFNTRRIHGTRRFSGGWRCSLQTFIGHKPNGALVLWN